MAGRMRFHLAADRGFTWELATADRGDADDSRLTAGRDLTAAGRDFTWQQRIMVSAVGNNRSWTGCALAAALFVFELVICEVVNL